MSQISLLPVPSVSPVEGRPATTSRDIARFFGKRHDDVIRVIRNLIANCPETFSARNFAGAEYTDEQGKPRLMYTVFFDGFMLLVMGYTGKKALEMKLAYIEAFNAMRDELEGRSEPDPEADRLSKRSDPERKALTAVIGVWVSLAPIRHAAARALVNAHFGVDSVDKLTVRQVKEAIDWVQSRIDAIDAQPRALPTPEPELKALPEASAPKKWTTLPEYADRINALAAHAAKQANECMKALSDLGFALLFRPACLDSEVSAFGKILGRKLPSLCFAAETTIRALCNMLEVYLNGLRTAQE